MWRCRYCEFRNPAQQGNCGQCWRAYIPNLKQLLSQTSAQPFYTPLWWGYGKGKGKEALGFGKGTGKQPGFGQGAFPASGGKGPPAYSQGEWRGGRRQRREARDAALAASLATGESESDWDAPTAPATLLGAARAHQKAAKDVEGINPVASAQLKASSRELFSRAHLARPLPEQVAALEKKLGAKKSERDSLEAKLASLQQRLAVVQEEGEEVEHQLNAARAKLAAAPSDPPQAQTDDAVTEFSRVSAYLDHISGLLTPEMSGPFQVALAAMGDLIAKESAARPAAPTYAQVASPTEAAPAQVGASGDSPSEVALALGSAPSASPSVHAKVVRPLRGRQAQVKRAAPEDVLVPLDVDDGDGFIPFHRSRSSPPSHRLRSKTSARAVEGAEVAALHADATSFLARGARYWTPAGERAGLSDGDDL